MYEWTVWGMKHPHSDERYFCGQVMAESLKEARTLAKSTFLSYPFFELVQQGSVVIEREYAGV